MISAENLAQVSIVLPIYNEGKYIRETLESIVNQDYRNLEVIVSDNHSSDQPSIIWEEFAQKDDRICYHRHSNNIGVLPNHIFSINKILGKYFMIASGHDKWSTNLISECVYLLEFCSSASVAYGTPSWIGEDG
ncbi:MAG: glycosyltransferase family 2 protein [Desulfobulbaceae bacterium]|nr:glycosyltransferase family 2 protein [Desulfobulbaceae bacterium]